MDTHGMEAFSVNDFHAQRMAPYFRPEKKIWPMLQQKGFVITECPGDGGFRPDSRYAFKDNGSDIVCFIHADTVCPPTLPIIKNDILHSSAIDDRLGLYIAVELLERKGIVADIFVSSTEEMCQSSAQFFSPAEGKKYNWGFGLDRFHPDVALYQFYEQGSDFHAQLESEDFQLATGSYSDICECHAVGCKFLNLGIGYCPDAHSPEAKTDLNITVQQLNQFQRFWAKNHKEFFAHDVNVKFQFETLFI